MTTAYFDCQAGASGNMILGALLDAGLDKTRLLAELRKLDLPPWELSDEHVQRGLIQARLVDFDIEDRGHHHPYTDIDARIAAADLEPGIKKEARQIFRRLAEAEAHIHGTQVNEVEFHEVGAADSVLDVVGAALAFHLMGIDHVVVSPINTGSGWVDTAHGRLPVPAPATTRLLAGSGAVAYGSDVKFELLTPTGAAVLTHAADAYGPLPPMRVLQTGYGAGTARLAIPNVLRVTLGQAAETHQADTATVIETNIDDMNPEAYEYVSARLFAAGALDVWTAPIVMKGGRPATQLCALASGDTANTLIDLILAETTTLGVRTHQVHRTKLPRHAFSVTTPYGDVRVKASYLHGTLRDAAPEAADCRRIAAEQGVPWRDVYDAARAAGRAAAPPGPDSEN
ncbi:MAG: nickel pincer cofactor biosynthesis protein LarC [Chloroflexota bacterium]|nr:nickel pincer cofactor biosynthesis protein LarC [Chloroflexota bacterium]